MSEETARTIPGRGPRRILIVEDNADSAEVLQTFLEILGHRVEVRADAVEGISAARSIEPEIVICDIGLPGALSGLDVARTVRSFGAEFRPLMVALSGHGQPEDKLRAIEAGFDAHMTKPADFESLAQMIELYEP